MHPLGTRVKVCGLQLEKFRALNGEVGVVVPKPPESHIKDDDRAEDREWVRLEVGLFPFKRANLEEVGEGAAGGSKPGPAAPPKQLDTTEFFRVREEDLPKVERLSHDRERHETALQLQKRSRDELTEQVYRWKEHVLRQRALFHERQAELTESKAYAERECSRYREAIDSEVAHLVERAVDSRNRYERLAHDLPQVPHKAAVLRRDAAFRAFVAKRIVGREQWRALSWQQRLAILKRVSKENPSLALGPGRDLDDASSNGSNPDSRLPATAANLPSRQAVGRPDSDPNATRQRVEHSGTVTLSVDPDLGGVRYRVRCLPMEHAVRLVRELGGDVAGEDPPADVAFSAPSGGGGKSAAHRHDYQHFLRLHPTGSCFRMGEAAVHRFVCSCLPAGLPAEVFVPSDAAWKACLTGDGLRSLVADEHARCLVRASALSVHSGAFPGVSGLYSLRQQSHLGCPIWTTVGGYALFTDPHGRWKVGALREMDEGLGVVKSEHPHRGILPHRLRSWLQIGTAELGEPDWVRARDTSIVQC
ncbi:hypothetical protein DIPPA_26278 [Diplonema papillatum]|nr:hypothetical protein DIPPA_26278 [Diplonema papillatum]|eukprot:gene19743-30427_t